eukprot:TRINITY_DN3953_c0_g2_i1.p1 TRINITY_DN3953_c0_g2~~TRINITY_DN3953_c0_g2_i1.p1  ORF type:complete len:493 (-),score=83.79 TRINITY_DN3953_c0_g2_i1:265-1743(-)
MSGYDGQFPPLAPGKADKKIEEKGLLVRVTLAFTGERIAEFPSNSRCKVATVSDKLRDARPAPLGLHYELSFGEKKLEPDSFLGDLGADAAIDLQAHVSPTGSIVLPGVTGAAELPDSGDIIVASKGDITAGEGKLESLGPDDGPSSYMWLWRLSKSHGYALQHATLLTRRQCYSTEELLREWDYCVGMQEAGEPESAFKFEAFSLAMVKEFGEDPKDLPHSPNLSMSTWVYAHSDKYALLTWGKTGCYRFELGPGIIERLDIETGNVDHVSNVQDLWGIATDPRDGTIFCVCCDAGATVLRLGNTVTNLGAQGGFWELAQIGSDGLAFDPELFGGALVSPAIAHRREGDDETKATSHILVALPPGTDVAEALKLGGEKEHEFYDEDEEYRDQYPWRVVRFPVAFPSCADKNQRAMMSFACKAGKVACLDFSKAGKAGNAGVGSVSVITASLGDGSSTQKFDAPQVPPSARLITALNFVHDGGSKRFVFRSE